MSFFFNDFFGGGGMPGGGHFHGHGDDSDDEPVDTEKFYKLLGIGKNATQQEIKKAYRTKAKTLHPDRHPDEPEKYQALFQEVQAAHEVLKDPQKRSLYDKYGEKGAKRGGGSRTGSSLFEQMFRGHSSNDHSNHSGQKKSPPIKTALDVTLHDIYCGSIKKIKIHRRVAGKDSKQCPRCHGQGQITQVQRMGPMVLQQRRECPQCGGIGYKLERQQHEIEVHIPIGGRHGENITIAQEGNQYPDMIGGDVVISLRLQKHKLFSRKGADLGMNYSLSLRQALCGYKIRIPHVSGKTLSITPHSIDDEDSHHNYEIVQPGSLKVVHTMGLPQRFSPHIKGHLYIVMDVEMPLYNSLSRDTIRIFKKILPDSQSNVPSDNEDGNEDKDKDKDKEEIKQAHPHSQPPPQSNSNSNQKKKPQSKKKQQPKNKQFKNKKSNKKKNGKKSNKKKSKGGSGGGSGVFGGLQGHWGGGGGAGGGQHNKQNKHSHSHNAMDEDEDSDEMIEEVECHSVDGNPKATPASASNYYREDDDDEDGVQCRQM